MTPARGVPPPQWAKLVVVKSRTSVAIGTGTNVAAAAAMRFLACAVLMVGIAALGCSDGSSDGNARDAGAGGSGTGGKGSGGTATNGGSGGTGTGGAGGSGATSSGGTSSGGAGGSGNEAGQAPTEIQGYWVWEQKVENGAVTFTVTDADMESKVGPSGWPGCPDGILCTKYGIHKLAFGPAGEFWQMTNVTTGSDSNLIGTYSVSGSVVTYQKEREYSCAHPNQNSPTTGTGYFEWRIESDRLWVSQPFSDSPPAGSTSWLVLKPVTEADFYGKYMVRICQDGGQEPKCYAGCFSQNYGR